MVTVSATVHNAVPSTANAGFVYVTENPDAERTTDCEVCLFIPTVEACESLMAAVQSVRDGLLDAQRTALAAV